MNRRIKKKVAKRQLIKAMQGLVDLAWEWERREEERFPYSIFPLTVTSVHREKWKSARSLFPCSCSTIIFPTFR